MSGRVCRRCGAGYTVARPEKGRRFCDACRATRATFFTCPGCGEPREEKSASRDQARRPVRCWDCRQGDVTAARTASITGRVARVEPGLTLEAITASVVAASPTRSERKWLAEHLDAHPDALTSESAAAPRAVFRLVGALRAAGAAEVRLPRCPRCARPTSRIVRAGTHCEDYCAKRLRVGTCATCGEHRRITGRTPTGEPVCRTCWNADPAHHRRCVFCGELRRVNARTRDGDPACTTCYIRHLQPPRACSRCGRVRPVARNLQAGPLCDGCYHPPARTCGQCGRVKPIRLRATATSPDLCNACAWATRALCTRCGDMAEGFGSRRGAHVCLRCTALARFDAILGGDVRVEMVGLREAFVAAEQPRSLLHWLWHSPGARLLARLATGEVALTHAALDALPRTASTRHLHALLVATGALPERDLYLANLERTVAELLATIADADDARLIRSYARWHVIARLRRRANPATGVTAGQDHYARQVITEAGRFLEFLRARDRTLTTCTQPDVDAWAAAGARHLRSFLDWAAPRGHAPALAVGWPVKPGVTRRADHDARWALARRLLHDDGIDPADRVAGTLVVLYAQPLTRVAALRLDDRHDIDGQMHLNLGRDRVHLPEPLGQFLRDLPWRRQTGPSGHAPGADAWLFPGRNAGRHVTASHLTTRLRVLGINTRAMRTTALLQLGATLPPAVIAELLNLHPTTAIAWTKRSGGDWTRYAAARAHAATSDTGSTP